MKREARLKVTLRCELFSQLHLAQLLNNSCFFTFNVVTFHNNHINVRLCQCNQPMSVLQQLIST